MTRRAHRGERAGGLREHRHGLRPAWLGGPGGRGRYTEVGLEPGARFPEGGRRSISFHSTHNTDSREQKVIPFSIFFQACDSIKGKTINFYYLRAVIRPYFCRQL